MPGCDVDQMVEQSGSNMPQQKTLREWYNHIEQQQRREEWEQASWRVRQGRLRRTMRRVITAKTFREGMADICETVRRHGDQIRQKYGISLVRQFLQQCYLVFRHDTPAANYYTYRLYLPEFWADVDDFIYDPWPLHGALINRSFPEEKTTFDDKLCFFQHCEAHDLATPPVVAAFEDGSAAFHAGSRRRLPPNDIFVKERSGAHGHGIMAYMYEDGYYRSHGAGEYTHEALFKRLKEQSTGGNALIVQPRMTNHSAWQPFTSGALATIRFLTGRVPDGSITPLAATLRMPTGASMADNFSAGGIASAIDLQSGRLGTAIRKLPENGVFEFDIHPDTNQQLTGAQLPRWKRIREFACEVHSTFDTIFVGWDLSLTTDGLMVIEGNKGWVPRTLEIPQGTPLAHTRYATLYDTWMQRFSSGEW